MEQLIESWDSNFKLEEAKTKRPGVLATWGGEICFANLPSRNKRIYPTEAWSKALGTTEFKRLINDRLMFGTVGHHEADFDTLVREKKVSHVTIAVDFNKKTGIGKGIIDVLDTPVGRILNTLLQSGSKVCVSSKAIGEYKGEDVEGNQLVDPDKFKVERWDAVINPGYLQAQPQIIEKLEEAYHKDDDLTEEDKDLIETINNEVFNTNKEDTTKGDDMSKELAEQLMKDKVGLEKVLSDTSKALELSEAKVKNYDILENSNKKVQEEINTLQESVKSFTEFFEEVGSMEKIKETVLKAKAVGESIQELGGIDEITESLSTLEEFIELGDTPEVVQEALEASVEFKESLDELGDCGEGQDAITLIKEALEKSMEFVISKNAEDLDSEVAEVAAKFGVKEDSIHTLVKTEGKDGASKILEDLNSEKPFEKKKDVNAPKKDDTRLGRMFESASHK